MNEISRKTGKVADFPLKLDLQLFAGEEAYPSLEESSDFPTDAREFNAKMDAYVKDRESKVVTETPAEKPVENEPVNVESQAEKPEVADPDSKPKQDSETNKAFQEMRKAREEAERRAAEIEARAKKADELIAQQYGHMGITTVEQYEAALQREREAEETRRYEEAGLTADEIEKLRKYDELVQQQQQQSQQQQTVEFQKSWSKLYDAYPELVEGSKAFDEGKDPEWFTDEMKEEIRRGASPLAAYRNAHFDTIMKKQLQSAQEIAKQEALDKLNSKDHLQASGTVGGNVDHVEIDEETMRAYRALNKGKTDAQIRAWHKKHAMGG